MFNTDRNMNLSDYVKVYDNAMSPQMCQRVIERFNKEEQHQIRRDDDVRHFTEININQAGWPMSDFMNAMIRYRNYYFRDCGITKEMINPDHGWEEIRIKRYRAGEGEFFLPHNDVWDYNSARRFLVFFWYLNDVTEGGETQFHRLDRDIRVQPKAGRLLMFPPIWPYLHSGLAPISNDKYIVGGYLHYK